MKRIKNLIFAIIATQLLSMMAAMTGCGGKPAARPINAAFVHYLPAGHEYAAADKFFTALLQGGLPEGSQVAFYYGDGSREWGGDYMKRTAIGHYQAIANPSGRTGCDIVKAVRDARQHLSTVSSPDRRNLLILIAPLNPWNGTQEEKRQATELLHYSFPNSRGEKLEVFVIGVPEDHQPDVMRAWQGHFTKPLRLFDPTDELHFSDFGLQKSKHD